jgi:NTP pyrophosphatase (non-canonical NTP hydrolase)
MKDDLELQNLYAECVEFWGLERQLRMLQEECGELIVAVSHFLRERPDGLENLIEELADVKLMGEQITSYVGKDNVMKILDYKSDREASRLKESKERKHGNQRH